MESIRQAHLGLLELEEEEEDQGTSNPFEVPWEDEDEVMLAAANIATSKTRLRRPKAAQPLFENTTKLFNRHNYLFWKNQPNVWMDQQSTWMDHQNVAKDQLSIKYHCNVTFKIIKFVVTRNCVVG